jgi:hypothetical protein
MGNSEIFWAVLILKMKREPRMDMEGHGLREGERGC